MVLYVFVTNKDPSHQKLYLKDINSTSLTTWKRLPLERQNGRFSTFTSVARVTSLQGSNLESDLFNFSYKRLKNFLQLRFYDAPNLEWMWMRFNGFMTYCCDHPTFVRQANKSRLDDQTWYLRLFSFCYMKLKM